MKYVLHVLGLLLFTSLLAAGCEMAPANDEGDEYIPASETAEDAARMTSYSVIMAAEMGSFADGDVENTDTNDRSISFSAQQIPEVYGPEDDGQFTIIIEPDTFYVSWLIGPGDPIVIDDDDPFHNLIATVEKAQEEANYFLVEGDFRELEAPEYAPELMDVHIVENNPDFEFAFNTEGDILLTDDGIANGKWYSEFEYGGYADFDFIDVEVTSKEYVDGGIRWIATGGKAIGETVLEDVTYTSEVHFQEDGTGEGTIASEKLGYEADLFIDTWNGGGYYEDVTGEHHF